MKHLSSSQKGDLSQELLIFLCTLYDLRHLGQTAARLCISLPKASRMLAEARLIFDDPLFCRFGRGLALLIAFTELLNMLVAFLKKCVSFLKSRFLILPS